RSQTSGFKRYDAWRIHQSSLMKAATWQAMQRGLTSAQQASLKYLEKDFLRFSEYAHCSSEVLSRLAFDWLPSLIAYYELLLQEYNTYKNSLDNVTKVEVIRFIRQLKA